MQTSFVPVVGAPRRPRYPERGGCGLGSNSGHRICCGNTSFRSQSRCSLAGAPRRAEDRAEYTEALRTLRALRAREAWPRVIRLCADIAQGPLALYADGRLYAELFYAWMKRSWHADTVDATALWEDLCSQENSASLLGPRAYMSLVQLLSKHTLVDDAIRVRRAGRQFGFVLNRYVYNAFLNACAKRARLDEAFATLEEMATAKVSPDVVSFNCLISCCINSGDLDMALTVLERMRDWGIEPDIYSMNSIVNGLRKAGRLEAAFQLVAKMEIAAAEAAISDDGSGEMHTQEHTVSSSTTNGESAHGATSTKHFPGRSKSSSSGVASGPVNPDLVSYNTLLAALANQTPPALQRALRLKRHIERRGLVCNEVSYNLLLATAARGSHIREAFSIYSEMVAHGIRPNCECFTTLITLCARAKMIQRAFTLHQHMVDVGIRPSVVTFNALITACRHTMDGDRALEVLEIMKKTPGCEPDVITYSTVIDTLGKSCRLEEVQAVLKDMKRCGVEPNLVTYTSIIAAWTRGGDFKLAMETLAEMEAMGIAPNVYTYSSLINGAGRSGSFAKAFELLGVMREQGIKPGVVTFLTLIRQTANRVAGDQDRTYFDRALKELGEDNIIEDDKVYAEILQQANDEKIFGKNGKRALDTLIASIRAAATKESWGGVARRPLQRERTRSRSFLPINRQYSERSNRSDIRRGYHHVQQSTVATTTVSQK